MRAGGGALAKVAELMHELGEDARDLEKLKQRIIELKKLVAPSDLALKDDPRTC